MTRSHTTPLKKRCQAAAWKEFEIGLSSAHLEYLLTQLSSYKLLQPGLVHTWLDVGAPDKAHQNTLFTSDEGLGSVSNFSAKCHNVAQLRLLYHWTKKYGRNSHCRLIGFLSSSQKIFLNLLLHLQ